jgi:peroxiredoxin
MSKTGETAPDFTLSGARDDEIREFTLSEFADGRPTMVVFYVHDFSPVCTDQMCEVNDMEMLTLNNEIAVVGVSPDGPYSHREFIQQNNLSYPLLTDDEKSVYEAFGMVERTDDRRQTKRGIVLLDPDRTVQYRWVAEDNLEDWEVSLLSEAHEIAKQYT